MKILYDEKLESMGAAPGLPHLHWTLGDMLIRTWHANSRSFFYFLFIFKKKSNFVQTLPQVVTDHPSLEKIIIIMYKLSKKIMILLNIMYLFG